MQLVEELACPDCEVTVYDLREGGAEKPREYGISTIDLPEKPPFPR